MKKFWSINLAGGLHLLQNMKQYHMMQKQLKKQT